MKIKVNSLFTLMIILLAIGVTTITADYTYSQSFSDNLFNNPSQLITPSDDTLTIQNPAGDGSLNGTPENMVKIIGNGSCEDIKFSKNNNYLLVRNSIGVDIYNYSGGIAGKADYKFISKYTTNDFCMTNDESLVYIVTNEGELIKWNFKEKSFEVISKVKSSLNAIDISDDDNTLVTGGDSGIVLLWDTSSAKAKQITSHNTSITSVAIHSGIKYIASGDNDGDVKLTFIEDGTSKTILNHNESVLKVKFSRDGSHVASSGIDNAVRVYDIEKRRAYVNGVHNGWVRNFDFSNDDKYLLSAGDGTFVYRWEYKVDEDAVKLVLEFDHAVNSVAFSNNGGKAVISVAHSTIYSFDFDSALSNEDFSENKDNYLTKYINYAAGVYSSDLSKDGKYLVSGHEDGSVILWNLENGKNRILNKHEGAVYQVKFTREDTLILSSAADGSVGFWDANTLLSDRISRFQGEAFSVDLSPDKIWVASSGFGEILLWNIRTNITKRIAIDTFSPITGFIYSSPATAYISLGNGDIMNLSLTDNSTTKITNHDDYIFNMKKLDNGLIFTASNDNGIKKIENNSGVIVDSTSGELTAFTPDSNGNLFFITGENSNVYYVDMLDTTKRTLVNFHVSVVKTALLSPDNAFAYTGSLDGTIRMIDLNKSFVAGEMISRSDVPFDRVRFEDDLKINTKYLSPAYNGKIAVINSMDGSVYAYDINAKKTKWKFNTNSRIDCAALIDDKYAFVVANDQNIFAVDLNSGKEVWKVKNLTTVAIGNRMAQDSEYLYIAGVNNNCYKLKKKSGDLVWKFETNGVIYTTPIIYNDKVFFGCDDKKLYCLDINTGKKIWDNTPGLVRITSVKPLITDSIVQVIDYDGALSGFDINSGEKKYSLSINKVRRLPIQYSNNAYYISSDGTLTNIDINTGKIVWNKKFDGSKITITKGSKYIYLVNSKTSEVVAIDPQNGEKIWDFNEIGDKIESQGVEIGKTILFMSSKGKLVLLNTFIRGQVR